MKQNRFHVQDSICKPPVQCDEEKVSGGSEVRTNLLQLPADIDRSQVSLQYNFFEIPDRLEFYYDGEQIFAIGPASGEDTQTLPIPDAANQIGIALTGSQDPKTKWWYKISCSQEEGNGEQGTGNGERGTGKEERSEEVAVGCLPVGEFLRLAIQIAQVLEGLYRQGVIHKDIKPQNILINPSSKQVKLTDFSISSYLPREHQPLHHPSVLEGTLAYMNH